jgi:hypothetical protein
VLSLFPSKALLEEEWGQPLMLHSFTGRAVDTATVRGFVHDQQVGPAERTEQVILSVDLLSLLSICICSFLR